MHDQLAEALKKRQERLENLKTEEENDSDNDSQYSSNSSNSSGGGHSGEQSKSVKKPFPLLELARKSYPAPSALAPTQKPIPMLLTHSSNSSSPLQKGIAKKNSSSQPMLSHAQKHPLFLSEWLTSEDSSSDDGLTITHEEDMKEVLITITTHNCKTTEISNNPLNHQLADTPPPLIENHSQRIDVENPPFFNTLP